MEPVEDTNKLVPEGEQTGDEFQTVEEIAKLLKVKPKTIYNWSVQGLIPCYRMTNRILRFKREEVKQWFKEFKRPGRKPYKSEDCQK